MAVTSDPKLLGHIRGYGTFDTNACFQCGSCSVTCDLVTDSASFPRRTIRYALLGLREPLLGSVDPWLCYYCGDCSTSCPRKTEPAEAMMTLRRYLTAQYDWTGLASLIHRSKYWAIGAHLIVATIVLVLVVAYHLYVVKIAPSLFMSLALGMEHMFDTITVFTLVVFFLALFFLVSNGLRMFRFVMHHGNTMHVPLSVYLTEIKGLLFDTASALRFRDCQHKTRWIKHTVLASGCLVIVVILIFFLKWFQTDNLYPIYHPQRWVGYLAAAAIIYGAGDILISRIKKREPLHMFSDATDWIFPISLLLTALSGMAIHVLRYTGFSLAAHYAYAVHLAISVPLIVIEIPFGKWSHMLYRPLAVYLHRVKEAGARREPRREPALIHAA